jgi:hypothetical protein
MRWVRDLALLIIITGFIGGGIVYLRMQREQERLVQQATADVLRLETELKYRSATGQTELNARGWPVTVDPKWFDGRPPVNSLVSPNRPWVEVAGTEQAGLLHPPVRMAVDETLAGFWYNPYQGIVRARVPVMMSDERSLEVYNRINSCFLAGLYWREKPIPTPDLNTETPTEQTAGETAPPASDATASTDQTDHPDDSGKEPGTAHREPVVVKVDRSHEKKPK